MSHVTSCRLPRVFSFPFARLSLSLSFVPLRPPQRHLYLRALTAVPRTPPFTNSFCFLRWVRDIHSLESSGAPSISSILGNPRSRDSLLRRLNVILYDLFDFASQNPPACRPLCYLRSSSPANTRMQSGFRNLHVAEVTFSKRRETISFSPNYRKLLDYVYDLMQLKRIIKR